MERLVWSAARMRRLIGVLIVIAGICLTVQIGYQWASGNDPTRVEARTHVQTASPGHLSSCRDGSGRSAEPS